MDKKSGGDLLVECLVALGAKHSFGVPGESYLAILNALHDTPDSLKFTICRNEGGAAFMAAAYGKLTGNPGICFVTRGPGATNASIGIHTAMQDSVPMIMLIGQVDTTMRGREAFQEIDYRAFYGSVAKWVTEIDHVDRIPETISRAWTTSLSGRPGPVIVALPENLLTDQSEVPALTGSIIIKEPAPSSDAIQAVQSMLLDARHPVVMIGGGGWTESGRKHLQSFAEKSNLPVVASFRRVDLFDNHSPNFVGDAGVGITASTKSVFNEADLILAINIRFGETTTDSYTLLNLPRTKQKLIHVHSSANELGKIYIPDLAIHAGPNQFCAGLAELEINGSWEKWRKQARRNYERELDLLDLPSPVDMGKVTSYLSDRLPKDAIVTNGAGNFTIWPNKFIQFGYQQRLLAPQSGAMGYGLPAAIAAKVVYPMRTVVCFSGDGDFQMTLQELGTAMQIGAQPIVLILNNGMYGTIRMHQEREYPSRVFGTEIINPDFVMLAKSYGYHAEKVKSTEDFKEAFERALASDSGAVLDLAISAEAITPRQRLSDLGKQKIPE
ncbi:MAG: thiamine pyrophosphate-binding protein [Gammaproteobacteria bacterium]|nr:thiamine pyrophosphate-binding protein [Gammaproteobacteria bacterium]